MGAVKVEGSIAICVPATGWELHVYSVTSPLTGDLTKIGKLSLHYSGKRTGLNTKFRLNFIRQYVSITSENVDPPRIDSTNKLD